MQCNHSTRLQLLSQSLTHPSSIIQAWSLKQTIRLSFYTITGVYVFMISSSANFYFEIKIAILIISYWTTVPVIYLVSKILPFFCIYIFFFLAFSFLFLLCFFFSSLLAFVLCWTDIRRSVSLHNSYIRSLLSRQV